jgi:hypothetical protein
MIKVVGRGGAPDVTISGPGGVGASTAGQASTQDGPFIIRRAADLHATYIGILHPRAGRYTIHLNPGSPGVAEVLVARGFTPHLRAHVTGAGRHRQLSYAVNIQPGEKVSFFERGRGVDHLIGTTRVGHGTLHFTSAPGPGGTRQIIATATENGQPVVLRPGTRTAGELVIASYRASGPARLGAVHRLRAHRTRTRLTVTFSPVRGATQYAVVIALREGLRTDYLTRRHSLTISVPSMGPLAGTVEVRALGDDLTTASGPIATSAITIARAPTRHRRHTR